VGFDLFGNLAIGAATALSVGNVLYCLLGVTVGTLIGVLPGIGPSATIAMLLPITFGIDPTSSIIMLAGIFYGAQYGGSITAILVNLPGEASSAVTVLDGHQMARAGQAGAALAISAIGSFIAGTISTFLVALFAPPLAAMALKFGPADYFSLIVLGLIFSVSIARGSLLKALAMVALGLLLGTVGMDTFAGVPRFTLGVRSLSDGLDMIALALGLFGFAEIIKNLENEEDRREFAARLSSLLPTRADLARSVAPILRGTTVGSVLGVLPGGGATLSAFAAYALEKWVSPHPERFGTGAIEGVAAPESANNAGAQTSFIPMLTLGIPSNPVMALMIAALLIHGIVPGPGIMNSQPELFWGVIVSMWLGNLFLVILNLPLIGIWVRLLTIPYFILFPLIVVFSIIGTYSAQTSMIDLYTLSLAGLFGYLLLKLDCEPAPLLLGFILGPRLEEYFRRAMVIDQGDPTVFVTRPLSLTFLGLALVMLIFAARPSVARRRTQIFSTE
jgi:putative tricarboxylic transport membrane protein